ncbi:MAG TPA: DUF488 domain-containing protein [Gemmatimonadales bacterium]|nr:DUF488 domain-containing protein [Gemmatimonadales bacterium]
MRKELATIGYQAATVCSFLEALARHRIDLLVDVRAVASSRRPGFAKSALVANLRGANIEYLHLKGLGTPAEGRAAARAGRHAEMKRIFEGHMKTAGAQAELETLAEIVRSDRRACLLCLEADPAQCHRSLVAAALGERLSLRVTHLSPRIEDADR